MKGTVEFIEAADEGTFVFFKRNLIRRDGKDGMFIRDLSDILREYNKVYKPERDKQLEKTIGSPKKATIVCPIVKPKDDCNS